MWLSSKSSSKSSLNSSFILKLNSQQTLVNKAPNDRSLVKKKKREDFFWSQIKIMIWLKKFDIYPDSIRLKNAQNGLGTGSCFKLKLLTSNFYLKSFKSGKSRTHTKRFVLTQKWFTGRKKHRCLIQTTWLHKAVLESNCWTRERSDCFAGITTIEAYHWHDIRLIISIATTKRKSYLSRFYTLHGGIWNRLESHFTVLIEWSPLSWLSGLSIECLIFEYP